MIRNSALLILVAVFSFTNSSAQWQGVTNSTGIIYRTGSVGIGTSTPTAPIEVIGDVRASGKYIITNVGAFDNENGNVKVWANSNLVLSSNGGYSTHFFINTNGNIGIGTVNPDFKLTVNGNIKCEEMLVVVDVPADYVFDLDYKLMPLSEVGKYIKENKHLPNVPSAEEIKQNGWQVGEMNNKLLEKVEELTLYLLQLKDENEALKARVEALESQKK